MKLARKIVSRMVLAGLVLGTPSAVFARNGEGGGENDGVSQGQLRAAMVRLMDAATAALNSGACDGESIPDLPE